MNDDRQAGRKEIGGGGEWTALWEALGEIKELLGPDSPYTVKRSDNKNIDLPEVMRIGGIFERADEALERLEALAAAAPADTSLPKVVGDKFVVANGELRFLAQALSRLDDVAPPPQDGQGSELLGPPRGGSSSDLAEQATELRKLPEMWLEVRRKIMDGKGAAKPDAEDLSYADAMKHCAIELNRELRKYDF